MSLPTAKQLAALAQETPCRSLTPGAEAFGVGLRLGLGTIDHVDPFQRSISVPISSAWYMPTAKQFFALVQETALSVLGQLALFGLFRIAQLLPRHTSMSVLLSEKPTAVVMSEVVSQATDAENQ